MTRLKHANGKSKALTTTPGFKPRRDRAVLTTVVVCPTCKAAIGEVCTTSTGKQTTHESRRRMALRKEHDDRSATRED